MSRGRLAATACTAAAAAADFAVAVAPADVVCSFLFFFLLSLFFAILRAPSGCVRGRGFSCFHFLCAGNGQKKRSEKHIVRTYVRVPKKTIIFFFSPPTCCDVVMMHAASSIIPVNRDPPLSCLPAASTQFYIALPIVPSDISCVRYASG